MQIGSWRVSNKYRTLQIETQSGLVTTIQDEINPIIGHNFVQFIGKPLDDLVGYMDRGSKVDVMLMRIVNDELTGD